MATKATLINPQGQKIVVDSGSPDAQKYFGMGYTLMGSDPAQGSLQGTTTQLGGSTPPPTNTGTNPIAFSDVINTMRGKLAQNNDLMDLRNKVFTQLYDRPLTDQEKASLTPSLQHAINTNNRTLIDYEIRNINDQIAGRQNTLDSSIKYLTDAYQTSITQAETQKQNAIDNVIKFTQQYGSEAPAIMKSLYGQQYMDQLKSQYGIDIESMASLPSLSEQKAQLQYGTPPESVDVTIPQGTLAFANNNPGNLRFAGQDGATQGQGGFAKFSTPEAGYQALINQIQLDQNRGLTVEQFVNKYAPPSENNTEQYIQQFTSTLGASRNQNIATLDSGSIAQFMAKKESGSSVAATVSPNGTLLSDDGLMIAAQNYLAYGTMPSLGLGQAKDVKATRAAIIDLAGKLSSGQDPASIRASIKAGTAALTQQTEYVATMQRAVDTVDKNLDILMKAADKVNTNDSPLLNEWENMAARKVIGSGDLAAYTAALQTVRNEYQFILARGGEVTEGVRAEAQKLIPDNISKSQLQQVVDVLKQEGQNVLDVAKQNTQNITGSIGSGTTNSPTSQSGGGTYEDYLKAIQ